MSLCQAKGCTNEPMPDCDLCGFHDELSEPRPVIRKTLGRPLKEDATEEKAALWDAQRERQRNYKREHSLTKDERRVLIHEAMRERQGER